MEDQYFSVACGRDRQRHAPFRIRFFAVREQLRERAARAHSWFDELTAKRSKRLSDCEARERVAQLGLFLMEIAGDLQNWQKELGAILEEKS
jgi:hypothetical protein